VADMRFRKDKEIDSDINISTDIMLKRFDDLALEIKLLNMRLEFILESVLHENKEQRQGDQAWQ